LFIQVTIIWISIQVWVVLLMLVPLS